LDLIIDNTEAIAGRPGAAVHSHDRIPLGNEEGPGTELSSVVFVPWFPGMGRDRNSLDSTVFDGIKQQRVITMNQAEINRSKFNYAQGNNLYKLSLAKEPQKQAPNIAQENDVRGIPSILKKFELFIDQNQNTCAVFRDDLTREVHYVSTKKFSQLLDGLYYDEYEDLPSKKSLSDGIRLAEFQASRQGQRIVYQRFAFVDGSVYIDMCDGHGSIVVVDETGYTIRHIS
jgi:hypothetical protein